jgi:hypothetical protein
MLRFDVYTNGQSAENIDLSGAYAFGQDGIAVRADLVAANHQLTCMKQMPGACGITIMWPVNENSKILLSTTRLPEHSRPYNLNLELARGQLLKLYHKLEDWFLFDYAGAEIYIEEFHQIRKFFIEAIKTDVTDPPAASKLADEALEKGVLLGEKIALFHANLLSKKRIASNNGQAMKLGTGINLPTDSEKYRNLAGRFDFIQLPLSWRQTEPKERIHEYEHIDRWVNWAARNNLPIHAGPLLSFHPNFLPDWLYIWRNDFAAMRKLVYAHVQRTVERYRQVKLWNVVSGLAALNTLQLTFDQISELTRDCCQLVKKLAPDSQVMIELIMPFGEYYARNPRTIPPLLYADMVYQADIKFDAFGLPIQMGASVDGHFVRDMLQISSLLDEFLPHGKGVHITACQAPSSHKTDKQDAWGGKQSVVRAGSWHGHWSDHRQAEWLEAVFSLAASKPYIQSLCWNDLADLPGHTISHGGLCRADLHPKTAYRKMRSLHHLAAGKTTTPKTGNHKA